VRGSEASPKFILLGDHPDMSEAAAELAAANARIQKTSEGLSCEARQAIGMPPSAQRWARRSLAPLGARRRFPPRGRPPGGGIPGARA